jgi:hypothetical protein
MGYGFNGQSGQDPQMPSAFFDGMRLGLEGAMLGTLAIAIPAGMHIGLSATLGYAVRYADGLPAESGSFSFFGFFFPALLGVIFLAMALFFAGVMPTMLYTIGLVAFMMRWLAKGRGQVRRTSIVLGGVLGLIVGVLLSGTGFLLLDLRPDLETYTTLFHWPEILTFEGIALLWLTILPVVMAAAGFQTGRKLGDQLEALTMHWFWY